MAFEILDTLSIPGNQAKPNDDAFAHYEKAAVVLDGATGLGEPLLPGPSDAAWIARFGANRLMAHLREGETGLGAIKLAFADAERSFKGLRKRVPQETWELPFASMMLAVESAGGFDAFWYGDCAALVKRANEPAFIVGEAFDRKERERERVMRIAQIKGVSPAAAGVRDTFLPSLRRTRNFVNKPDGSYLFGPDPIAADHTEMKRVSAPAGTLALIASDGFLALVSEYARYDLDGLMSAAQSKGLAVLGEELRAIEDADPDGANYPRFKKSDDATAVLLVMT